MSAAPSGAAASDAAGAGASSTTASPSSVPTGTGAVTCSSVAEAGSPSLGAAGGSPADWVGVGVAGAPSGAAVPERAVEVASASELCGAGVVPSAVGRGVDSLSDTSPPVFSVVAASVTAGCCGWAAGTPVLVTPSVAGASVVPDTTLPAPDSTVAPPVIPEGLAASADGSASALVAFGSAIEPVAGAAPGPVAATPPVAPGVWVVSGAADVSVAAGAAGAAGALPAATPPTVSTVVAPSEPRVTTVRGPVWAGAAVPGSFRGTVMVWACAWTWLAAMPRDSAATAVSVTVLKVISRAPYSAGWAAEGR